MTSVSIATAAPVRESTVNNRVGFDKLPDEMNDMKISDEKVHDLSIFHFCPQFSFFLIYV